MLYRSFFPNDVFAELERMRNVMDGRTGQSSNIRGATRGYPAVNVGATEKSIEIYALAPGVTPEDLDVQIENGVLTIRGERKADIVPEGATVHVDERFSGNFRRVVSLPDDIDPNAITANYHDGVLHVSVKRKEAAQPRRIQVN